MHDDDAPDGRHAAEPSPPTNDGNAEPERLQEDHVGPEHSAEDDDDAPDEPRDAEPPLATETDNSNTACPHEDDAGKQPLPGDDNDAPDASRDTKSPLSTEGDNADPERLQKDNLAPERPSDDDVGPDTPPAELVRRIRVDRIDSSRGTFKTFCADIRTIIHLHWLQQNICASKKPRARGATIGGADYLKAADEAGVKRAMAYAVIKCRLFERLDDIWRQAHIEADQWRERTGHDNYGYPSLTKLISRYKGKNPSPAKDDEEDVGLAEANQTPQELRDEVLWLTDALTMTQRDLEQARADFRRERAAHDQDNGDYERRLKLKEQRIAFLEDRVAELEQPTAPSELPPIPGAAQEPVPPPQEPAQERVPDDARFCLADRGRSLDVVNDLETRHGARKWRGPLSRARQVRADFLTYLDAQNDAPVAGLPDDRDWWEHQDGVAADDLVAKYRISDPQADPEPPPPAAASAPAEQPDPEPPASAASAVEAPSESGRGAGRDAITQDIAKMLSGRIRIAKITGSTSGIVVTAHDERKQLFVRANLTAHLEIEDEFALDVVAKHEGRYLVKELRVDAAGKQAKIKADIPWDVIVRPDAKSDLLAACKIAKAEKEKEVSLDVIDGKLSFAPADWHFSRADLEWLMRKGLITIRFSKRGLVAVTVPGIAGNYEFLLRGTHS